MEPRIGLAEAARLMRPDLSPVTVNRWILVGVRCPDKSRLKLKAIRVGSKWVTTASWVNAFLDAQTAAFVKRQDTPTIRSPDSRKIAAESTSANLAAAGW